MAKRRSRLTRKVSEVKRGTSKTVRSVKLVSTPQYKSKRFKTVYKTRQIVTPKKIRPEIIKKVRRFKEGTAFKRRFRYLQEGMRIVDAISKKKRTRPQKIKTRIPKKEKMGYIPPSHYRMAIFGTSKIPIYQPMRGPIAAYQLLRFSTSERRFMRTGRATKLSLIEIHVSEKGKKIWNDFCISRHISILDWKKELYFLARRLRNMLTLVSDLYIRNFEKYVPEETGALKRSLRESLYSGYVPSGFPSNIDELHLLINFGSELPYVNYLQKKTIRVRHEASNNIISRRTRRPLHDPKAIHGFLGLIQTNLRIFLSGKFYQLINETRNILGITWNEARSFWTVRGLK